LFRTPVWDLFFLVAAGGVNADQVFASRYFLDAVMWCALQIQIGLYACTHGLSFFGDACIHYFYACIIA
jgi:hypothetical protein